MPWKKKRAFGFEVEPLLNSLGLAKTGGLATLGVFYGETRKLAVFLLQGDINYKILLVSITRRFV